MLLQDAKPLIEWMEPVHELVSFVALFLAAGAVGFRFSALRAARSAADVAPADAAVLAHAGRRAAAFGLGGAVLGLYPLAGRLAGAAARAHSTVGQLATSDLPTMIALACAALAVVGFALAAAGKGAGWPMALAGVVFGALPDLFTGKWSRLINPVHSLAAGLWIGTLFVLVAAGLTTVLRERAVSERRGALVASLVNGFSPLALTMGGVVVLFGLITAWRHLNPLSSLWTTPYGYALLAKLAVVAVVFGLGAWNWRRQRPTLGSDAAAVSIRRSSVTELCAAAVVLVITAILVSLPSPRPPKPAGPPAGAPATATATR